MKYFIPLCIICTLLLTITKTLANGGIVNGEIRFEQTGINQEMIRVVLG